MDPIASASLTAACDWPRDIRAVIEGQTFDPPPWNVVLGPLHPRGEPAGVVIHGHRMISRWGQCDRPDMAFSVAKTYAAILAALALDRGLIDNLDAPVSRLVDDPAFASARNAQATWRQLLDQTSEWGGVLFGVPHEADRDRQLAPTEDGARFNRATPLQAPGTYWDYNDIRVNALCLALTRLFRAPLPRVLAELHPVFAPETGFAWHGYGARSTIDIDGAPVEVVVGGGHWGGGVVATVDHHLALGTLLRDRGAIDGVACVSAAALDRVLRPCPLQPVYGGLCWFNTDRALFDAGPADSLFAMGVGATVVWSAPSLDVVAVARWIRDDAINRWIAAIRAHVGA